MFKTRCVARVLGFILTCLSFNAAHAQVPMTGAGKSNPGGVSTVLFDASGFSTAGAGSSPATITLLTVGSASNRALVVYVGQRTGTLGVGGVSSVTYNGVAMTEIGHDSVGAGSLWGLVNPASGAHSIVATFAGGGTVDIGALSVSNANQTGGATTFHGYKEETTPSQNPGTITNISTANGEICFGGFLSSATHFTGVSAGIDIGLDNSTNPNAAAYITASGATATLSYSLTGNEVTINQGVSIKGF